MGPGRGALAGAVAACVAGAGLAGCGVRSEPIAQPQVSASVCLPAPSGPVTQGTTALRNSGEEPARITRVALRGAQGISVVDVRVFVLTAPPGDGATLVGALDEFPPDSGPTVGLQEPLEWNAGSGVPGPELPADPDAVANVVLGVTRSAPGAGTAEGIDVTYTSGGREYTWRGQASLTLAPAAAADRSSVSRAARVPPSGIGRTVGGAAEPAATVARSRSVCGGGRSHGRAILRSRPKRLVR